MVRVLIADDHAVVRAGLRQFLEEDPSIGEIGEASTGREVLEALRAGRWDLLILDINMPDRSGLDILSHIRAAGFATRVLVMSGLPERQYALNVLRAGARFLQHRGARLQRRASGTHVVYQQEGRAGDAVSADSPRPSQAKGVSSREASN